MTSKNLILADYASITPSVREYIVEYLYRHPDTQLCVICPDQNLPKHMITEDLFNMQVPFDAVVINKVKKQYVPPITFKTMMLTSLLDNPEYTPILAIDTDQEALEMYLSGGVPFTLNPLRGTDAS